jgi:hypothetical protein
MDEWRIGIGRIELEDEVHVEGWKVGSKTSRKLGDWVWLIIAIANQMYGLGNSAGSFREASGS